VNWPSFSIVKTLGARQVVGPGLSVSTGSRLFGRYTTKQPPGNYEDLIKENQSWVYTCASRNAQGVAGLIGRLYVKTGKTNPPPRVTTRSINSRVEKRLRETWKITKDVAIEEVVEHNILNLIRSPNPFTTESEFREGLQNYKELVGDGYVYAPTNRLGIPSQLWLLPSQWVTIIPSKRNFVDGYLYGTNPENMVKFSTKEVGHTKFFNPASLFYGMSPLEGTLETAELDRAYREYETAINKNMARPDMVMVTQRKMNPAQKKELLTDWNNRYAGVHSPGQLAIVDGIQEKGELKPIAFPPRDMANILGRKLTFEQIAAAFDVPKSVLTTESVNRSNAEAGLYQWMRDAIKPRSKLLEEFWNSWLIPKFDPTGRLFYAYDNCIPQDKDMVLKEREINQKTFIHSINEEREIMGEPPVEWGSKPWGQMQMVELGEGQKLAEAQAGSRST